MTHRLWYRRRTWIDLTDSDQIRSQLFVRCQEPVQILSRIRGHRVDSKHNRPEPLEIASVDIRSDHHTIVSGIPLADPFDDGDPEPILRVIGTDVANQLGQDFSGCL